MNYSLTTTAGSRAPRAARHILRHILRLLSFFLLAVATLLLGASLLLCLGGAWVYTHPHHNMVTITPGAMGLAYQDITFPSAHDGTTLSGWLIPAMPSTNRAIILVHGIGNVRWGQPGFPELTLALHARGFTVLAFDLRDSGRSAGTEVTLGSQEQYDVVGAANYLRAHVRPDVRIGLLGISLGAASSLLAAGDDPADIRAVVADSAYADLGQTITREVGRFTQTLASPASWLLLHVAPLAIGFNPADIKPITSVRHLPHTPVLYIAGTEDQLIDPCQSVALYRASADRRSELWLVPSAPHAGAYTAQPKAYTTHVLAFFSRYVQ